MIGDIETDLRFQVSQSLDRFGFSLMVGKAQQVPGKFIIALPANFEEIDFGARIDHPLLRLNPNEAKSLMDELWRNGIRPSNGEGNVGQIGALEAHLEDMREIAFKQLKIPYNGGIKR